ncbi:hypothetical protein [Ruminococcus sp.]|uniref:nucleotide-binding protein n=1 Tax=Ruminococcus sp. TaxID=41978 RepID=UPI0039944C1F
MEQLCSVPRILISATGSGCGKTTVTAAILGALCKRELQVQSFKCGPDYLDPMFHQYITGRPAYHADPFFPGAAADAPPGFPCGCISRCVCAGRGYGVL